MNSPEESNPSDAKPIYLYRILSRHRQPACFWNMSGTITPLRLTLQAATASRRAADLLHRVALKKRSIFVVNERQLRMKLQCDEARRRRVVTGAFIDKTGSAEPRPAQEASVVRETWRRGRKSGTRPQTHQHSSPITLVARCSYSSTRFSNTGYTQGAMARAAPR